jgi:hypothetical protein
MSKEYSSLCHSTGKSNVIPLILARKPGIRTVGLVVIVLALLSLVAAAGMRSDSAGTQGGTALQAAVTPGIPGTEFVYFPGQYVNQATEPSEHIQAF